MTSVKVTKQPGFGYFRLWRNALDLAGKLLTKQDPKRNVDIDFMATNCFEKKVSDTTGRGEFDVDFMDSTPSNTAGSKAYN